MGSHYTYFLSYILTSDFKVTAWEEVSVCIELALKPLRPEPNTPSPCKNAGHNGALVTQPWEGTDRRMLSLSSLTGEVAFLWMTPKGVF